MSETHTAWIVRLWVARGAVGETGEIGYRHRGREPAGSEVANVAGPSPAPDGGRGLEGRAADPPLAPAHPAPGLALDPAHVTDPLVDHLSDLPPCHLFTATDDRV